MIDYKILKRKEFWFWWFGLSLLGGIISFLYIRTEEAKLTPDKVYYVKEYRKNVYFPSILVVESDRDTANYIRYFKNSEENLQFNSTGIPDGTKLYVLYFNQNKTLAKVYIKWPTPNRIHGSYSKYWVWHEFLTKEKP